MNKNSVYAIGLMSGTSLDGVDVIYARIHREDYKDFEILVTHTYEYEKNWQTILKEAIDYDKVRLDDLDKDFGFYLAELVCDFLKKNNINKVDFISSHGHTVLHQPDHGITLQIGNGQVLSNNTGIEVVCDFRTQDVKNGGQGAPLVPIGDLLMFSNYDACLNLGGFANISFQRDSSRVAFDICPVNTVLNFYSKKMGFEFDNLGKISSSGIVNHQLFKKLNSISYYDLEPPKSLGIEWVHKMILPLIESYDLEPKDILRTYTEHVAFQISKSLSDLDNVLVTGGGAYNLFLINRIKSYYAGDLILPDPDLIEYKEALIFILLGLLKKQNKINCLSSVTGAKEDHVSGRIFNPKNH